MRYQFLLQAAVLAGTGFFLAQDLQAQQATVEGTISEAGSGSAVENATVVVSEGRIPRASGTTDANGFYSVSIDMDAGGSRDVVVEAAGPEHAPGRHGWGDPLPCYFGCGIGDGTITVAEGSTVSGIDIALESGGKISGRITAADTGDPLTGANLHMIREDGFEFSNHFRATTDGTGDFVTPLALPPADYHLLAYPAAEDNYVVKALADVNCQLGVGCPIRDTSTLEVLASVEKTDIDFALKPGASIEGTLFPDDIERSIRLYDGSGKFLFWVGIFWDLPSEDWSFNGLSGGSYYIEIGPLMSTGTDYLRLLHNGLLCPIGGCNRARGAPIAVSPGSSLSLAPLDLQRGGQIEGTIVDADTGNAPIGLSTNAQLARYDVIKADGTVVGGGLIREEGGQVVLAASGGILPGDYYVRTYSEWLGTGIGFSSEGDLYASIPGYADAVYPDVSCAGKSCDLSSASTVSISEGNITSIQIEIATGSNISGRVTDKTDSTIGMAGILVKLINADNEMLAATVTDDNGDYEFGAFPPGTFFIRTSTSGRYGEGHLGVQNAYFDQVYGMTGKCSERLCEPTDGTAITLDGISDATGIDMEIEAGPIISGRIIDISTGLPINNGHAAIYDSSGILVGEYRLASQLDSRYRSTALPPDTYTVIPVVSPAFSDVSTSGGSDVSSTRLSRSGHGSFTVTIGEQSVEADLQVVDSGLDIVFQNNFMEN